MCYTKPNQLSECNIPNCPESLNDAIQLESGDSCTVGSFSCDNGSKCISEKFQCDYEVDCIDGTDEQNCEDYLQYYELIGAYRLIENIIEVWTFIPHVQGVRNQNIIHKTFRVSVCQKVSGKSSDV